MKRWIHILLLALITTSGLAKPVTLEKAREKASVFLTSNNIELANNHSNSHARRAKQHDNQPSYYIFNATDRQGFVVVSGEDATCEILAYSEKGHFGDKMPEGLLALLDNYDRQIHAVRGGQAKAAPAKARRHDTISPIISSQWDQGWATKEGDAYNMLCPTIDDKHCVTGCVATAMAQVMHYYQWPKEVTMPIPGYESGNIGKLDTIPPTTFNWLLMPDIYDGDETMEEKSEVAKLMLYCGISALTKYDLKLSEALGSDATRALKDYFGYSSKIRYIKRADYDDDRWEETIYHELACSRPVIYFGFSSNGGHCFICDGYSTDDFYHINWGWGGEYDGFFKLSILTPEAPSISGILPEDVEEGYSMNQHAIIGIIPAANSTAEIIHFADSVVKTLCVNNWDNNGDGELDTYEAKMVLSLDNVFYNAKDITSFNELNHFKNLKTISAQAFEGCEKLESIKLPNNVTNIGSQAFKGCAKLQAIFIPKLVAEIGEEVFGYCRMLSSITVDEENKTFIGGNTYNAIINKDNNNLVAGCNESKLPNSLQAIGPGAFSGCDRISVLPLPDDLISIGDRAFASCTSLTNITLPATIDFIGKEAFAGCKKLGCIYVNNPEPATCGADAFKDVHAMVYVPKATIERYLNASEWNKMRLVEVMDNDYIEFDDIAFTKYRGGHIDMALRNIDDVVGFQFRLTLPKGVHITCDSTGYPDVKPSRRISNHTLRCTRQDDGTYVFLLMSWTLEKVKDNEGTILGFNVEVDDTIKAASYTMTVSNVTISTIEQDIINSVHNAPIEKVMKIRDYDLGDVNGDKHINVTDVMIVVDYILNSLPNPMVVEYGDLDQDSNIDVTDAMRIVQIILNSNVEDDEDDTPPVNETLFIASPTPHVITMGLESDGHCTAMQMRLVLPKDATVSDLRLNDDLSSHHAITANDNGDGSCNVIVYSNDGTPFPKGRTPIIYIETPNDEGRISVSKIIATNTHFETLRLRGFTSDMDAIRETESPDDETAPIYNLAGQRINTPHKGIYIVKGRKFIK